MYTVYYILYNSNILFNFIYKMVHTPTVKCKICSLVDVNILYYIQCVNYTILYMLHRILYILYTVYSIIITNIKYQISNINT